MAISDKDIFDWFLANPGADDATIAATMDQFKLSPADIARATGTDLASAQSRYEAVAPPAPVYTPAAPTPVYEPDYSAQQFEPDVYETPAYTPPATNAYFQANPDVAAAYAANSYGMSADDFANFHYNNYGRNEGRYSPSGEPPPKAVVETPPAIVEQPPAVVEQTPVDTVAENYWKEQAALQQAEWERLAAIQQAEWERQAASTPVVTEPTPVPQTPVTTPSVIDEIAAGPPTTEEEFLEIVGQPPVTAEPPADNINTGYTNPATRPTGGGVSNVIEGDDIETQIAQLPEEIAHWARSADQRYMELINDKTGAVMDRRAVGDFSDLDLLKTGLSFIPGAGQALAAVNIADALRTGNVTGALIGATGLDPSLANVNTALKVGQAIDQNNPFGAVTALAGNTDLQKLTGLDAANVGGLTAKDATAAANLTKAAIDGNVGAALSSLGTLTDSPDTTLAGKAVTLINRLENGDIKALGDAVSLTNNLISGTTASATSPTAPAITTLSDEDLAELQPGELQAYQDGGVQGLADFRRDMRLLNSLTTSGRTGDDLGGGTIDEVIKDATTTETTTPADTSGTTGVDTTDLGSLLDEVTATGPNTDSGLSNQDLLDMNNATDDTVVVKGDTPLDYLPTDDDFVPTKIDDKGEVVITGGRPTDTTGLDEGPIIPTGGDGLETVTVTGGTGNDTITGGDGNDSVTGGTGNDTVPLSCPEGYEPNEAGTACIPVVVIQDKKCDPGYVYDEDLKQCVPIKTTEDTLTGGTGNDDIEELVVTDKKCDPGYVYDEDLKQCVPIVTTPVVTPPVVKTTPTTYTPSTGIYTSGEENKPLYAEGMDEFNLLATLQQLLAEEPEKKDSKKSKEKTKMATGGHLDDLLAEQMTVDDLLKLLR